MFDHVSLEAIGIAFTIIGATYIFIKDLKRDIKEDMNKFERHCEKMDEKHEEHRELNDNRWFTLLNQIHYLDKKIWELDKKIEQSQSFEKEPSR